VGQDNSKFGDIGGPQAHAVESVGDVNLSQFGRAKPRVGMDQVAEKTLQGAAKLHSLRRCQPNRLLVDPRVCIVDDEAGAAIPLGDNAQRGDTEMWESGGRQREGGQPRSPGCKSLGFPRTQNEGGPARTCVDHA
jgi:hypothetical protein